MVASWSALLVVLLTGTVAFAAPGQELVSGPHRTSPPPGKVVKEGEWLMGYGEHFDPPRRAGEVYGYALDSGHGNHPIRVAVYHEDKPCTVPTEPLQKYEHQPTDAGFISMARPPVIKAEKIVHNFPADGIKFGEMKHDIRRNCGERLFRRDGPGSCQLPKKVPAATVNPAAGRKKK